MRRGGWGRPKSHSRKCEYALPSTENNGHAWSGRGPDGDRVSRPPVRTCEREGDRRFGAFTLGPEEAEVANTDAVCDHYALVVARRRLGSSGSPSHRGQDICKVGASSRARQTCQRCILGSNEKMGNTKTQQSMLDVVKRALSFNSQSPCGQLASTVPWCVAPTR